MTEGPTRSGHGSRPGTGTRAAGRRAIAPIVLLATKDLRLLARDRVAFFFTFVFPLIFGVLFGLIFSGAGTGGGGKEGASTGSVELLVVDLDRTALSSKLIADLDAVPEFAVVGVENEAAAIDRVRTGVVPACVIVPAGYAAELERAFAGGRAPLRLVFDPARRAEAAMVKGQLAGLGMAQVNHAMTTEGSRQRLAQSARAAIAEADDFDPARRFIVERALAAMETEPLTGDGAAASDGPGVDGSGAGGSGANGLGAGVSGGGFSPLDLTSTPVTELSRRMDSDGDGAGTERRPRFQNAFELTIPQGVAWGLMGCVLGFGLSLVQESNQGTLVRLLASPLRGWQVLAGKGLACFSAAVAVQAVLYGVSVAFLGVWPDSWWLLALAMVCGAFGFTGMMLLLATLGRTTGGAEGLGRAVLLTLALLGGAGVPLFFLSGWMQTAAGVSPFKWLILAHEGAIWRDASFAEMVLPCGVLVGIGVVCAGLAGLVFARSGRTGE